MIKFLVLLLALAAASASKTALEAFAKANNLFAASVYKEILKVNNANFLVSPYSAEAVLALAHSGSKGKTAEELKSGLHLPKDKKQVETGVKASIPLLAGNKQYFFSTAHKIYLNKGFTANDGFKKAAVEVYGADIESIDFVKKVEAASKINKWVEEKTNNKIHNLVKADRLSPNLKLLLVNALLFKATWSNEFQKELTRKEQFHKTNRDVVEVDMMHHHEQWFNFHDSPQLDAKFLELPFRGDDVALVIALPNKVEGLKSLEKQIDKVLLPQKFQEELLNIALPKFKIKTTVPFVKILKNLGINSAFDDTQADFSGIAGHPGDLFIGDVLQKTYIDVVETGVEASAGTYVGMIEGGGIFDEPEPKNFVADHPFIFYLRVERFIIFVGRVLAPSH